VSKESWLVDQTAPPVFQRIGAPAPAAAAGDTGLSRVSTIPTRGPSRLGNGLLRAVLA